MASWERDLGSGRGRGRGRGSGVGGGGGPDSLNFVRGEVLNREGVHGGSTMHNNEGAPRGRGRGMHVNRPAWMTNYSDNARVGSGPGGGLGGGGGGNGSSGGGGGYNDRRSDNYNDRRYDNHDDEDDRRSKSKTMELLLAQARQVQEEQQQQHQQQDHHHHHNQSPNKKRSLDSTTATTTTRDNHHNSKHQKLQRQKEKEEEEEEAAKKAIAAQEEETKRLEQLRDLEEERQLRALMGDTLSGDDDNDDIDEFETEEEREERMARERREERRKKLRLLDKTAMEEMNAAVNDYKNDDDDDDGITMKVDNPRNPAGVIESETNEGNNANEHSSTSLLSGMDAVPANDDTATNSENNQTHESHNNQDSDDDSFDMFASNNSPPLPTTKNNNPSSKSNTNAKSANARRTTAMSSRNAQECDDAEGYYKANIGEIITLPKYSSGTDNREYHGHGDEADDNEQDRFARFRVLGIIGKGVFSSVIKCVEESTATLNSSEVNGGTLEAGPERVIAMKIIRNNEIMAKAAAKEMRILRILCRPTVRTNVKHATSKKEDAGTGNGTAENGNDNNNGDDADDEEDLEERERRERENHNIVRLIEVDPNATSASTSLAYSAPPPEFRSHCIFLFEFLPFNLREVLSKFGKNVGINLTAVRSYARQLLCALAHLEKHRIVHADLKPDNILVSANFSTVKLADFGSAFFETDHDNDPTPYLVSRFYRPPEVILGLEYDRMVDLWSTSVTLAELFTGSVLFPGNTNNDMLVKFMDTMGPFSHKMVRRHAASYTRMGLTPHFEVGITGGTYQLCKHDVDRVTRQPVVRMVNVLSAKADARLPQMLLKASRGGGGNSERVEVLKFADFLARCLALDPARRLSVRDALKHEFFMKKRKKES